MNYWITTTTYGDIQITYDYKENKEDKQKTETYLYTA